MASEYLKWKYRDPGREAQKLVALPQMARCRRYRPGGHRGKLGLQRPGPRADQA